MSTVTSRRTGSRATSKAQVLHDEEADLLRVRLEEVKELRDASVALPPTTGGRIDGAAAPAKPAKKSGCAGSGGFGD